METEQDREVVPAGAWAEAKVLEEAGWVDRLLPGLAEIAYALNVAIRPLIWWAIHVAKMSARNVERK